jgi:hypothetical protein
MSQPATSVVAYDKVLSPFRPQGGYLNTGAQPLKGWFCGIRSDGTIEVAQEVPGYLGGGWATRSILTAPAGNNTDGINLETGIFSVLMLTGDEFKTTDGPRPIYAVSNQEFGRSPVNTTSGAARSIVGCFLALDPDRPTTYCIAWLGPEGIAMALGSQAQPQAATPTYDAVITTIAAYTGTLTGTLTASAAGAIGAQDGVTLTPGMRVILPLVTGGAGGATVAADSGPYLVVSPGGAGKFQLVRPPEYPQSGLIPEDFTVRIGTGTVWSGIDWRAFPTAANKVVGTDDPHFWPRTWSALASVTVAITNAWIKDVNKVSGLNITSAHAFWASTLTAGAGTGAITYTGTAADQYATMAINW